MSKTLTAEDVARNPALYDGSNGKSVRCLQVDGDLTLWTRAVIVEGNAVRLSCAADEREISGDTPIHITPSI